jgi:hypothetical protein
MGEFNEFFYNIAADEGVVGGLLNDYCEFFQGIL